jgi:hypothetical protein
MARPLLTILTLILISAFICGCQPPKEHTLAVRQAGGSQIIQPAPESKGRPQPEVAEPEEAESETIETETIETEEIETEEIETETIETEEIEPDKLAAEETEPERKAPFERSAFYDKCEHVFSAYVDEEGMADYKTLRRKRAELIDAAREFDRVHPAEKMSWSRNEKIAFWINAHNIFTVKLIVDNYPIEPRWYLINYPDSSIMHIVGGRDKKYFKVMGMEYTLREIEREILLERFKDPRIFFALSYASMGGAFLRNEAYQAEKLDEQLDEQVKKFLSSPRGMRIDRTKKIVFLSDIFNWYKKAFVEKYGSIKKFREHQLPIRAYLNFIINYVSDGDVSHLKSNDYVVRFQLYDWRLNEQLKE